MSCEYSHTKSESLAQISTTMAEIQHFFLGDCFFIGAPCIMHDSKACNVGTCPIISSVKAVLKLYLQPDACTVYVEFLDV